VTKVDVKETLEKVYGIGVSRVHTVNYEGKKKRSSNGKNNYFYRRADYKKVYVQLHEKWYPPTGFASSPAGADGDAEKRREPLGKNAVKDGEKRYWLESRIAQDETGEVEMDSRGRGRARRR
jgi:large subunit ribosomal protein L23